MTVIDFLNKTTLYGCSLALAKQYVADHERGLVIALDYDGSVRMRSPRYAELERRLR